MEEFHDNRPKLILVRVSRVYTPTVSVCRLYMSFYGCFFFFVYATYVLWTDHPESFASCLWK